MSETSPVEEELLSRCRRIIIDEVGVDQWAGLSDDERLLLSTAFLVGIRVTQGWVSERLFGDLA